MLNIELIPYFEERISLCRQSLQKIHFINPFNQMSYWLWCFECFVLFFLQQPTLSDMTMYEMNFSLLVEDMLQNIDQPEYRQIIVEVCTTKHKKTGIECYILTQKIDLMCTFKYASSQGDILIKDKYGVGRAQTLVSCIVITIKKSESPRVNPIDKGIAQSSMLLSLHLFTRELSSSASSRRVLITAF